MRLFFVVKSLVDAKGGAERVFCIIASELAKRGHQVCVLSFDQSDGDAFYSLGPQVQWVKVPVPGSGGRTSVFDFFRKCRVLRRTALEFDPDVAIGFMHSSYVPLAWGLIRTGIPVLGSEHTVPAYYETRKLELALMLFSLPLLKKITVLSERVRSLFPRFLGRKMIVVPNPVSLSGTTQGSRRILSVGRLEVDKGQEVLVAAFAEICRDYPGWTLRLVGDGALAGDIDRLIRHLGVSERASLIPAKKGIEEEYESAEVFAMPSAYESFGLVMAEAMAYGLAVVAFEGNPGASDLIDSGRNGILVPGGYSSHAFASGLRELLADSELRARLGKQAKTDMKQYSVERIVSIWDEMLKSLPC